MSRYHRQILLPQIGEAGESKLSTSRVLLVGCGALGTVVADQLVRAGVGYLRIVDRDLVELSNLQRQVLFDESDANENLPKAVAAAQRLRAINSTVKVDAIVADVHPSNVEEFAIGMNLILDGTDNVATRYLINDVAVKQRVNWIYGAAVSTEGRMITIRPGITACLRCVFPVAPLPGELPTCDTVGVLGPLATLIGAMQSVAAIKLLIGDVEAIANEMLAIDVWTNRVQTISLLNAKRADCPACGLKRFDYLDSKSDTTTSLCGRDAMQIRAGSQTINLDKLQNKLAALGELTRTPYFLRVRLNDPDIELTIFPDGRTIIRGVTDPGRAKSIYSRFIGD